MKLLDLFFAARPMLHLPVWSVYLVALNFHHNLSGGNFDLSDLAILFGLSLLSAGAYYINQVFDFETDKINNKVSFLQRGMIKPKDLIVAYGIVSIAAIGIGIMISPLTTRIFVFLLVLSHIYSAPPIRMKDRPFAGLVANTLGHGMLVSMVVMPDMTMHNTGLLGWDNPIYFTLTVGGIYVLTTIPDAKGDSKTGKKTIATQLGIGGALFMAAAFQLGAAAVAYYSGFYLLVGMALAAALLVLVAASLKSEWAVLLATKLPILMLMFASCWFYPAYLIFLVVLIVFTRAYYKRRFGLIYPRLS